MSGVSQVCCVTDAYGVLDYVQSMKQQEAYMVVVPEKLLSSTELAEMVPYSLVHIWRLEKAGQFPKRIKLGARRVAWRSSVVSAWIASRATVG